MSRELEYTRFAVKAFSSKEVRPRELERTMAPHPLSFQELPYDPEYGVYNKRLTPERLNHLLHQPLHAVALKTRAEEVGLEAVVYAEKLGIVPDEEKQETLVSFFLRHLTDK